MSLRVETSPNQYTDYDLYSSARLQQFGQELLSLFNPNAAAPPPAEGTAEPSTYVLEHPSDLCRPEAERKPFYIASAEMIEQIEEHFLPHQPIFPYTPPVPATERKDEQMTSSLSDWPSAGKSSAEASDKLLSQIITLVQCRSNFSSSSLGFESQRKSRPIVRLLVQSQHQQQTMESFLDTINEALLLEPDTIKTVWDTKGEQILHPSDLLRRGRLYFVSREKIIGLDELEISDSDFASINRLETVREQLSQTPNFVDRPLTIEQANTPSRKSTPFNADDRRSATAQAQAIAYNDPDTFPEVFRRHYTVGDIIGDGRFSAVFECRDQSTGIQLALKVIDKKRCQGYEYLIENELAILSRVKHPNIIKLVEEFQNEQKYFLIFEYVSSGDLLTAITKMNKYSEHDVALMLSQIASALRYLHSLQIVHRDVKLDNILMTNYPDQSVSLKLADFGLALSLNAETPRHGPVSDNLCGTPMYLAPEVIEQRDYRVENDLWSLGIIAFTLLSGMAPFDGDNDEEIIGNVMSKPIDFNLLPRISAECRAALMSMLERDPNKRISASDLLQHPWIRREVQRRMEPINDGSITRRRKKGPTRQQPLLTFSSVEHPHPIQAASVGGLVGDIDEL